MENKHGNTGNTHAQKEETGIRISLYLSVEDMWHLRDALGVDATDEACVSLAKKLAKQAIAQAGLSQELADIAKSHGYIFHRGKNKDQGNPAELLEALACGEVASVLLADEERSAAIHWLNEQSEDVDDVTLSDALTSIAESLEDALKREREEENAF